MRGRQWGARGSLPPRGQWLAPVVALNVQNLVIPQQPHHAPALHRSLDLQLPEERQYAERVGAAVDEVASLD